MRCYSHQETGPHPTIVQEITLATNPSMCRFQGCTVDLFNSSFWKTSTKFEFAASLLSAKEHLIVVPRTKLSSTSRAFSVAAQKLSNSLPLDITRGLDRFAPVHVTIKRLGHLGNKWLTTEANEAKQERCWLERCYSRTRSPADKLAYHSACHKASALINSSRSIHLRNEVEQATGQPRMLGRQSDVYYTRAPAQRGTKDSTRTL